MDANYLLEEEVVSNLWREYLNLPECNNKSKILTIPRDHSLVVKREKLGLREIFTSLQHDLADTSTLYLTLLKNRTPAQWLTEWRKYHHTLFKYVLAHRGSFRDIDVRFGDPSDEHHYNTPSCSELPIRLNYLADQVCFLVNNSSNDFEEQLRLMAEIHHKFICFHPFSDGNGRIGRVIIDQLCLGFGLPMVMGSYPRTDISQRIIYHRAIKEGAISHDYSLLADWIRNKLTQVESNQ